MSARDRAQARLERMTVEQKIALALSDFAAVAELGIPPLVYCDGPNGVRGADGVTAFPAALALAAAFDEPLAAQYGRAVAEEARGKGHNVLLGPAVDIARTPLAGRIPESYGEDPLLAGRLAASFVAAVQAAHVIAMLKHFVANNCEFQRTGFILPDGQGPASNSVVEERTLEEIYLAPFRIAVEHGSPGSVMGSYNRLNGEYACQHPELLRKLKHDWGWPGFVAPDFMLAVRDPLAAANAGTDVGGLEGPAGRTAEDFASGRISAERLDDIVRRILFAMLDAGLFEHPLPDPVAADVSTGEHRALARRVASEGMVLLTNRDAVLPLDPEQTLAVIGPTGEDAVYVMGGSPGVKLPERERLVTPLEGIQARVGGQVRSAQGSSGDRRLPVLEFEPGLTAEYWHGDAPSGDPARTAVESTLDVRGTPEGLPLVWSARWSGSITPVDDGLHRLALMFAGLTRLYVDDELVAWGYREAERFVEGPEYPLQAAVELRAGQPTPMRVEYWSGNAIEFAELGLPGPTIQLGWEPPDARIAEAARLAGACDVAVVLANQVSGEGMDRTSLRLPGDQDLLIATVAAANPRTVVVLDTPGPVLMPWIDEVAAVVQAWFPGQEFGAALADVLFGDVDPGGRLPITFPATSEQGALTREHQYPGIDGDVSYEEGIFVGYRHYDEHGEQPLFAFGHGLSYGEYRYGDLRLEQDAGGVTVEVEVANVGERAGSEVVQLYIQAPPAAQEPPRQLKGFRKVRLAPGEAERVSFRLAPEDVAAYSAAERRWRAHPGRYEALVGRSSRDIRARTAFELS